MSNLWSHGTSPAWPAKSVKAAITTTHAADVEGATMGVLLVGALVVVTEADVEVEGATTGLAVVQG